MAAAVLSFRRLTPRVLLAAGIAASLICLAGAFVVVASRRATLQAGAPESLFGSLESFSWWSAGALGAGVYVLFSGVLLSAPLLRKHALYRALRVAAIVFASLLIPVAVHSAVELTRQRHPDILCILPGYLVTWAPWVVGVSATLALAVLERRVPQSTV